jgi:hypothetical protein
MVCLVFLVWSSVICRVVAVVILTMKDFFVYRLRHIDEDFLSKGGPNLRALIRL